MKNEYFVSIDKKSIKANPNAGSTKTFIHGINEIKINFCVFNTGKVGAFMLKNNLGFINPLAVGILQFSFRLKELSRGLIKTLYKKKDLGLLKYVFSIKGSSIICVGSSNSYSNVVIDEDMHLQTINHSPEDKWFYKYKNIKVRCNECGKRFSHTKLECDENYDGSLISSICPYCKTVYCCEVEYEEISEVAK